jgi:2-octaprenyl-6-methoxyphenol hydroxylase
MDYDQIAVVANVGSERPHTGCAYERFTSSGPLAVLPRHDGGFAVIWACRPARAQELLALADDAYLRELQTHFGWRAGRFVRAGRRSSYPLKLTRALSAAASRTVLIGNAAQALHPVAGQGFNLGLRDAAMLAEVIAGTAGDVGAPAVLRRFVEWRARDRRGLVGFTDGLVRLFGDSRQECTGTRQRGLRRTEPAPRARPAAASCLTSSSWAGVRSGRAPAHCSLAAPQGPRDCRSHCSSRAGRRRLPQRRGQIRASSRCRGPASAC